MIENLTFIEENGIEAFLEKEEAKWRCSKCGGTICCHNGLPELQLADFAA